MRSVIIDTDTAGDDTTAISIALNTSRSKGLQLRGECAI